MKYLLAVLSIILVCNTLDARKIFDENQNDNELLEPFLFEKREEAANRNKLGISGDIRITGRLNRTRSAKAIKLAIRDRAYSYKVEANIFFDQTCGCFWTSMKISAVNNLSVAQGTYDQLKLKRALIGYKPYKCGSTELYGEIGRQCLSDKFDSEVMFGSPLDGGFFHYTTCTPRAGKFFGQGAFLVVDSSRGQYGWVGSVGWEDIFCTGAFIKYALIDWGRDPAFLFVNEEVAEGATPETVFRIRPSYLTSQILIGYKWCWGKREIKIFGAYLRNHDARRLRFGDRLHLHHARNGAYIGFEFGKVRKCGDWAIKGEIDYVEALCFPEFDNNGIGNDLGSDNGLFNVKFVGTNGFITIADTRSPLNYWGPKVEFAYAFSDNVSGRVQYMRSWGIHKFLRVRRRFERFEVKLIYSF